MRSTASSVLSMTKDHENDYNKFKIGEKDFYSSKWLFWSFLVNFPNFQTIRTVCDGQESRKVVGWLHAETTRLFICTNRFSTRKRTNFGSKIP